MTHHPTAVSPDQADARGDHDAAIIGRSRRDPELFAVIFRRHAAEIQRYVTARLGASAAEDVVAETFLAAFSQRHGYDPCRPDARPWLYGIATNLIGRHRRAELRQYRAFARAGCDRSGDGFTERVDAAVSASGALAQITAALTKLPLAHRDALLLIAWGGLSYEQAALALGVPVGTVRSRLNRARATLRKALGNTNPSALHEETAHE